MPRYYVRVTHTAADVDPVAIDLPDVETAKREAQRLAGELLHDVRTDIWSDDLAVLLTDENNLFVGMIDVAGQLSPAYKR
ncbi:DUF6894 family protein [Sphingomonas montanisoli]|uniref:DUF6894 domain-containing protein n=1 Tax=Sphingomonas montanisoli TaxID=2606412 RepID=A0A5D9BZM4_9SPHN|nr:hypothetical protein [Sphingomonas montanisoli]TZG24909.1 hypothetical protein FYJ91_16650 [Sphingomonas montanisoli]